MFKLTKRAVEGLAIEAKDYLVWDRDMRGFGVRVYPSGKKTYLIQYRAGRRTRRITIGQHGVLTADEARTRAKQLLGDVARGADPSAEKQAKLSAPTMAGLCDRFMDEYVQEHCKPTTKRNYATLIKNHIKPKMGQMRIGDVGRADVIALHYGMRNTPYQANRALALLSKMFNVAEDWGLRTEGTNPVRRIKKNREEEKKRYLSNEEQTRLGTALSEVLAEGCETIHVVSAFMVLLLTGCRRNEIQTLQWDYVHHRVLISKPLAQDEASLAGRSQSSLVSAAVSSSAHRADEAGHLRLSNAEKVSFGGPQRSIGTR